MTQEPQPHPWRRVPQVAYFVSLGTAIGFYLYFLLTNEVKSPGCLKRFFC